MNYTAGLSCLALGEPPRELHLTLLPQVVRDGRAMADRSAAVVCRELLALPLKPFHVAQAAWSLARVQARVALHKRRRTAAV